MEWKFSGFQIREDDLIETKKIICVWDSNI